MQGLFSFVGAVSAVVLAEPPTKNENDVKPNGSIYRTKEKYKKKNKQKKGLKCKCIVFEALEGLIGTH